MPFLQAVYNSVILKGVTCYVGYYGLCWAMTNTNCNILLHVRGNNPQILCFSSWQPVSLSDIFFLSRNNPMGISVKLQRSPGPLERHLPPISTGVKCFNESVSKDTFRFIALDLFNPFPETSRRQPSLKNEIYFVWLGAQNGCHSYQCAVTGHML